MKLFTHIDFAVTGPRLSLGHKALTMGSCFAENAGTWLHSLQYDIEVNPTGIIYNPLSLCEHVRWALEGQAPLEEHLQQSARHWVHTSFHSSMAHPDRDEAIAAIQAGLDRLRQRLLNADMIFVTFGSSVIFTEIIKQRVANNCHRLPQNAFTKSLAMLDEMKYAMEEAFQEIQHVNRNAHIYISVSPVRHLRHGAVMNQRSKARLLLLCEWLQARFSGVHYLPVYEYVMDELRDYRFYRDDDLLHLGPLGFGLLKEQLHTQLLHPDDWTLLDQIQSWKAMEQHVLRNEGSEEASHFLRKKEAAKMDIETALGRNLHNS